MRNRSPIRPRVALCTRDCSREGDVLVTCPCDKGTAMHCLDWADAHAQALIHTESLAHRWTVRTLTAIAALAETEGAP